MPDFTFTGMVGGGSSGVTATINVIKRSLEQVAPEALVFDVSVAGFNATGPTGVAVYDDRFHELDYYWDFGDSYTFTAPQNTLSAATSSGNAIGPVASHTYRAAGTYTVTVTVYEPASGKSATGTFSVVVGNADATFPGTATKFVSPSSDWTNAPTGAAQHTTLDGAIAAVKGAGATAQRIMLNRGESYSMTGTGFGATDATTYIVAGPGAGAKPVVTASGGFGLHGLGSGKDFVLQNIVFNGPCDSTTNTRVTTDFCTALGASAPNLLLWDGVESDGWDHHIYNSASGASASAAHRGTILNDSVIVDYTYWGFADADKLITAITGCRIMSDVDAFSDCPVNGGGPLRGFDGDAVVSRSELFSRQGWTDHGPNAKATQHCIRFNSEGAAGVRVVCVQNTLEGGHGVLGFKSAAGSPSNPVNAVIDGNYLLGDYQTYSVVMLTETGVTLRNNTMVFPSSTRIAGTNDPNEFVRVEEQSSAGTNTSEPVNFYNNTLVNLSASGSGAVALNADAGFTNTSAENNVIHQPNIGTPQTADAPLEASPTLFSVREKGYWTTTNPTPVAGTATPAGDPASFTLQAGSAALDAATTGNIARRDILAAVRPSPANRGARE